METQARVFADEAVDYGPSIFVEEVVRKIITFMK